MITVYGPRSTEFATKLKVTDAVVADADQVAAAYLEAARRRTRGEAFYGQILFEDQKWAIALRYAAAIPDQVADPEDRVGILSQLGAGTLMINGRTVSDMWKDGDGARQGIGEFSALSTAVLVRSHAEWTRMTQFAPRRRPYEIVVGEAVLPDVEREPAGHPAVVIWAPNNLASHAAWHVIALQDYAGLLTVICCDASAPPALPTATFVTAGTPPALRALARAQAVVCVDPDDPGAAIAFARRGYGVIAPSSAGAHEFVRDSLTFDVASPRELQIAVAIAVARPASLRSLPPPPPPLETPRYAGPEPAPLVSVIVATYNRPHDLRRAMAALAAQTYPNLEIVVMNDAGQNVDEIVAPYANARIVNLPVNGGALKAVVEAGKLIHGEFVQLLADDDTLYPDHITRTVNALLATGAAMAHGNTLIRYQRRGEGEDDLTTVGFNAIVFNDTATPVEAKIATPISGQSFTFRRAITDEIGWFREDLELADQEFQLRVAAHYPIVYVDHMTAEWRVRGRENFSSKVDSAAAQRKVYDEHPLPGRPRVEAMREATLKSMAARPPGFIFPATLQFEGGFAD